MLRGTCLLGAAHDELAACWFAAGAQQLHALVHQPVAAVAVAVAAAAVAADLGARLLRLLLPERLSNVCVPAHHCIVLLPSADL